MLDEYIKIHVKKKDEIRQRKKENDTLRRKFEKVKRKYEQFEMISKPNFIAKILKPSSMEKYQERAAEYEKLKQEYENLRQIVEQLQSDDELDEEIDKIENEISDARKNIRIVIKYYIENNISIVLTQEDKENCRRSIDEYYNKKGIIIGEKERSIKKLEDIMLVHKTNFAPINGEIGTRLSSNVVDITDVMIDGIKYNINLRPTRNSVHFTVNHEVAPNNGGNWNLCKYAVLTPLLSIPKEQFSSNNCVDTFTKGKVELTSEAFIICPADEIEQIKKKNPNVTIIGYKGETVMDYANTLLWMLGYSVELGNDWGFEDVERENAYTNMISNAGYESTEYHYYSKSKEIERKNYYISYIIGVIELVKNNPELYNIDSETIINDSKISEYLSYCDEDTYKLFNYYLSEIGIPDELFLKKENIKSKIDYKAYSKLLIDTAKNLGKNQTKKI